MRPVDKLAGASRLGVAAALGALALGAAPASIAHDQSAAPAQAQPAAQPAAPAQEAQPAAPGAAAAPAAAPVSPPEAAQDCAACHGMSKDAPPMIGPNLWGVVGRQAGSTSYAYSPAMKAYGKTWTPENLQAFVMSPASVVPGTAMTYPGVSDPAAAKAVVDYLATLKD